MTRPQTVGVIGDFNPKSPYHLATDAALQHAGQALDISVETTWLPTESLAEAGSTADLARFDALWCAPGSPYASMAGALEAIRYAREKDRPFFGT